MKTLLLVLAVALTALCLSVKAEPLPGEILRFKRAIEKDYRGTIISEGIAAIEIALSNAVVSLRREGAFILADQIEREWFGKEKNAMLHRAQTLGIGDHAPWSKWLDEKYMAIEFVLGQSFCVRSHIAIIKSINSGCPVSLKPCSFPMDSVEGERIDEYRRHFVGGERNDEPYYGCTSEILWASCYVGCSAATWGSGMAFACGLACAGVEKGYVNFVGPKLSDRVYNGQCNG